MKISIHVGNTSSIIHNNRKTENHTNPYIDVYNAIIHLDELNPHAHVDFVPVGDDMKKGLSKQVSMNRAL
ncbi:plasmid recombination protein [Lactococcus lactis]|uniref:plasmid recombination protein n=1 Tax=Lactococcus lactis TaxID=1358 RepID=UPI003F836255